MQLVADQLDAIDDDLLRLSWALMSLRLVDWAIRHHTDDDIDHYQAVASTRLDF